MRRPGARRPVRTEPLPTTCSVDLLLPYRLELANEVLLYNHLVYPRFERIMALHRIPISLDTVRSG
jgi:hypothetical protein